MLAHAKLSTPFWVETVMTTIYVINRSPSTPLDGDIVEKTGPSRWEEHKPNGLQWISKLGQEKGMNSLSFNNQLGY